MQLDDSGREVIDDLNQTTKFDLQKHFKANWLSKTAYSKLASDVESDDINSSMLVNCSEQALNDIADGYKLSWIQKKAFINAVNYLI